MHRLLIVEDDPSIREALSLMLPLEIAADFAADGCEALIRYFGVLATPGRYDAILLDCGLPCIDGLSVGRCVRAAEKAQPDRAPTKLGIFTAYSGTVDHSDELKEMGISLYLRKPDDMACAATRIADWLNG